MKQCIFKLQVSEVYLEIDFSTIFINFSWLAYFVFERIQFIYRGKILKATTVASAVSFSFSEIQITIAVSVLLQEVKYYPLNSF